MTETSLGDEIRRARQRKRMTQQELASQLGVAKSTVVHWETGKHFPLRYAGIIEEALGIVIPASPAAAP
jgi:transcriptional regulator with XRE-family HTH domain